jgi:hypothetical protein
MTAPGPRGVSCGASFSGPNARISSARSTPRPPAASTVADNRPVWMARCNVLRLMPAARAASLILTIKVQFPCGLPRQTEHRPLRRAVRWCGIGSNTAGGVAAAFRRRQEPLHLRRRQTVAFGHRTVYCRFGEGRRISNGCEFRNRDTGP